MTAGRRERGTSATDPMDGVEVKTAPSEVQAALPYLRSPHHQLAVVCRLHEIVSVALVKGQDVAVDLSALGNPPEAIVSVLLSLEQDLRRAGRSLRIVQTRQTRQSAAAAASEPAAAGHWVEFRGKSRNNVTESEEAIMNETNRIDDFEERLLGHVEMVYAVALELTRSARDAEQITHSTMLQAWRHRDTWADQASLKPELLKLLRDTFINQYLLLGLRDALWTFQVPSPSQSTPIYARPPGKRRPARPERELAAVP